VLLFCCFGLFARYHGGSINSPPPVWTRPQRHALADSILVEYTNTFDLRHADPTPAGDGGAMNVPGGILTNIDSGRANDRSFLLRPGEPTLRGCPFSRAHSRLPPTSPVRRETARSTICHRGGLPDNA